MPTLHTAPPIIYPTRPLPERRGQPARERKVIIMARKIGRDSGSGHFIPVKEAQRRPKTTTVETLPPPKKKD
ncbi:MAG: hypothetical protein EOO38_03400 [Cytophagaceae bacterium]|nr:MAG: hypothetical protein EOO38_03400 [Cytophagaceae bacterium]